MRVGAIMAAACVGIASVLALIRLLRARGSARELDVGSVSTQWVAEHRAGSTDAGP